eukprot:jgi/Astpho2/7240/Aster-01548
MRLHRTSSGRGGTAAQAAVLMGQGGSDGQAGRKLILLPAAAVAAAAAAAAAAQAHQSEIEPPQALALKQHMAESRWLQQLSEEEGVLAVLDAASIHKHPLLGQDHMFSAMLRQGALRDMLCFYDSQKRKFHTVLQLGREVCGFPRIVHGGLTAAIMDETFGFLLFALKEHKQLPFWGPAYTAHLAVDYKAKINAGSTILCTCSVESMEGRKVWMQATISDGPTGKIYAKARALFVAPSSQRLAKDVFNYLKDGMVIKAPAAGASPITTGSM